LGLVGDERKRIVGVEGCRKLFKIYWIVSFMKDKIKVFMKKLKAMPDFDRVKFVILYGSYAEGNQNKMSDIDFAVYYGGEHGDRFKFRKKILGELSDDFDVQSFQDLPLYVRINVLKGKVIYENDLQFVYDVAYETIQSFEDFKYGYYDYIDRRPYVKTQKTT